MMPGMNGFQVAAALKADLATSAIPIIMVTALIDRAARLEGLKAGAEEFLTKPVDRAELWLRVRNLLRLKSVRRSPAKSRRRFLDRLVQSRTAELKRFRAANGDLRGCHPAHRPDDHALHRREPDAL
jgi:DNA-binding response OmpR family regulator